jgi:hypothetical protein
MEKSRAIVVLLMQCYHIGFQRIHRIEEFGCIARMMSSPHWFLRQLERHQNPFRGALRGGILMRV